MLAQESELGLAQVARIHGEMTALKDRVGFRGSLQDFFAFMREDKRFYYPNTSAGRQPVASAAACGKDSAGRAGFGIG